MEGGRRGVGGWDTGRLWRRGVVLGDIGSLLPPSRPSSLPIEDIGVWLCSSLFSPPLFLGIGLDIPLSKSIVSATSWILLSFALLSSHFDVMPFFV